MTKRTARVTSTSSNVKERRHRLVLGSNGQDNSINPCVPRSADGRDSQGQLRRGISSSLCYGLRNKGRSEGTACCALIIKVDRAGAERALLGFLGQRAGDLSGSAIIAGYARVLKTHTHERPQNKDGKADDANGNTDFHEVEATPCRTIAAMEPNSLHFGVPLPMFADGIK